MISASDTYVLIIRSEPVIDSRGQNNQIILLQLDANPLVPLVPHIKVSFSIADISDFFVLMQVFIEEHLDFVFVNVTHLLRAHDNDIAVLVASFRRQLVNIFLR